MAAKKKKKAKKVRAKDSAEMVEQKPVAAKKVKKKRTKKTPAAEKTKTRGQLLTSFRSDITKDPKGVKEQVAQVIQLEDTMPRYWISTGSLALDRALQHAKSENRGIPCGRVIEIAGEAHIGKSTLLDHVYANVQRRGGVAVLVETDTGRDAEYTIQVGVDTKELIVLKFGSDQGSIENAGDKLEQIIRWWNENSPDTPVIVGLDALGVTPTQEEISKSLAKGSTASAAKIVRVLCRKIAPLLPFSNVSLIVLNHEYEVISFYGSGPKPRKTYGGEGIGLLATLRLRLHRVRDGWVKNSQGQILGRRVGFNVQKWKLGNFCQEGTFAILSGSGIDNTVTLWDVLTKAGIIAVSGSWGAVNLDGETHRFQGWQGLRQKCQEDPALFRKLVEVYWRQVE